MPYKLFLDDERYPPGRAETWTIARSFTQAVDIVIDRGFPEYVSFDHDLGDGPTGADFARWLIERDLDGGSMPDGFDWFVHSQNPVGRDNINGLLRGYLQLQQGG